MSLRISHEPVADSPVAASMERVLGGFLRVLELPAGEAPHHPDAFDRIRAGELQAVLVHRVYEPDFLRERIGPLERNAAGMLQTGFPEKFRAFFYGRNLNLAEPGLPGYFDEAARFGAQLRAFFLPGFDLAERVAGVLAALDHGRPFVAPPGPRPGQRYMFATLRAHREGGYIPAHLDNEQALRPSYGHLSTLVELHMTSYVLTLAASEGGGALEVFDYRREPETAVPISVDGAPKPALEGLDSVAFRVPPGALIVLDSGRYLHRVTPVEGRRTRWTACSFMALSRRHDAMYCWG